MIKLKLLYNGLIRTCDGRDYDNGYILIEGKKIKAVGDMASFPDVDCEKVNLMGKTVIPGLVDAHSHIGLMGDSAGFEGIDLNESTDVLTPHIRALDGINPLDIAFKEALFAGVTTVMVGPGSTNPIGGMFAAIKTGGSPCIDKRVIKQPAAMKFAFGENPKKAFGKKDKMPTTRMGIAAVIREALMKAQRYDENNFDIKTQALVPVVKGEMLVKAHAHRADDIVTVIRIAKEFGLKLTVEHCTEGSFIVDYLKEEGLTVCIGPTFGDRGKPELLNKDFSLMSVLEKAGVPFAIITDAGEIPQNELMTCARLAHLRGISEKAALLAVTAVAADACEIEDRVGRIKAGLDADLAIYQGNPLRFDSFLTDVYLEGEKVEITT